jgi:hypothetical protein
MAAACEIVRIFSRASEVAQLLPDKLDVRMGWGVFRHGWAGAEGFFFTVYTRALASNIRYYSLYHGSGQGEITLPYTRPFLLNTHTCQHVKRSATFEILD